MALVEEKPQPLAEATYYRGRLVDHHVCLLRTGLDLRRLYPHVSDSCTDDSGLHYEVSNGQGRYHTTMRVRAEPPQAEPRNFGFDIEHWRLS